jgi:lipoprotein-releasing system permease protein
VPPAQATISKVSAKASSSAVSRFKFHLWLVYRFLSGGRRVLSAPTLISLIGMALGVASLTVAMGVVSGFEQTLKTAIIDVFGDIMLVKKGDKPQVVESITALVKKSAPEVRTYTPFAHLEGIMAGNGHVSGIIIEGFDPKTVEKVLNIRKRIIHGDFKFGRSGELPYAMVGKQLAKQYSLKIGDQFKAVLPSPSRSDSTEFQPRIMTFVLSGILDLGKAEYDERMVVTDLQAAQKFAGFGDAFTGIRIKLEDSDRAPDVAHRLNIDLGGGFWVSDWTEVNKNLLRAATIERIVIFFVISIIVLVASFNIASNLFVSVLKRYGDISTLRAMGFASKDVQKIFMIQGLMFGVIGTLAGFILGLFLCLVFIVIQHYVVLLPAETYHLDHIGVNLRFIDVFSIIAVSIFICLMSSVIPARKGAALDPVQGLRYE